MKQPTTTSTQLPNADGFLRTLEVADVQCRALLACKSPTVRIPANIRVMMQNAARLSAWWADHTSTYTALIEGAGRIPPTTTSRAKHAAA